MKNKLPKNVYRSANNNKYRVNIRSKKYDKTLHVGYFDSIAEALVARDEFVVNNYHDLTEGYLPRGISFNKRQRCFTALFTFNKSDVFIGNYKSLHEAVEARNSFIDSLK